MILLIAANGYIFIQSPIGGVAGLEHTILEYAIVLRQLIRYPITEYTTLFSVMFVHAEWIHPLGNML